MHTKGIEEEMNTYFMQLNLAEKKSVVQITKTFLQGRNQEPYTTLQDYK